MYPASSITELSAVDAALKAMELQVQSIKDRVRDDTLAIPKAKVLFFPWILDYIFKILKFLFLLGVLWFLGLLR